MAVILKWNSISKFCEWNFNSLDFVAIIQKKQILCRIQSAPVFRHYLLIHLPFRMKSANSRIRISTNGNICVNNLRLNAEWYVLPSIQRKKKLKKFERQKQMNNK
jgi:hypothetical protein